MDARGIKRGGCSACGCSNYNGGDVGMKCVDCGHPPGKHKKLGTSGSSTADKTSATASRPTSVPPPLFSVGRVRATCQYPGCENMVYFDMNTSSEFNTCRDHIGAVSQPAAMVTLEPMLSPNSTLTSLSSLFAHQTLGSVPSVKPSSTTLPQASSPTGYTATDMGGTAAVSLPPPSQRCKLDGCTRSRYQDSNGRLHDCCGKRHAKLYLEQQAKQAGNIDSKLKCKTPGCPRQRFPLSDGSGYYDYCSRGCRNSKMRISASTPNLASVGTCSLPGCNVQRYVDPANGRVHDYCSRSHAFEAQKQGIVPNPPSLTLGIRSANSQELSSVQAKFQQQWATKKGSCPPIQYVFVITNQSLLTRWQIYRKTISNKNIEEYYHGTKITCNIVSTQTLCSNQDCGVCGISSTGFDRRCIRKNINFQRFGHGFYLAPNSSKCHDYTQGINGYRMMILCDVLPGNKYMLKKDNEDLTGPPKGYDSVYGQTGVRLNYEEIVLYQPDAILPKYIIVYQKDGIHKIAA